MVWDGITTLVFTLLTSGILTYYVADKPFYWFSNLFLEAPIPNPDPDPEPEPDPDPEPEPEP